MRLYTHPRHRSIAASAAAAAAVVSVCLGTPSRSAEAGDQGSLPAVEFEKHTLKNGLQLILHVDRKLPIVHVNQWFHVGSKNEKPGRTGFAHLFEHIMFQGSQNASGEYFTFVENYGANLREGGVNGTTNNDRTNYFATVPSGNLEALLWLESDRLATLTEALTDEKLDNQRDVVKNERRQGLENQPYGRWFKLMYENLYPSGHPYSWPVIGSHEDLTAATMDDVKEFFRRYYTPNNLSLVIAGDFDPVEAKVLVEKYFGSIPPGPALDRPARALAKLDSEKVVEVSDRVPQERVYMAWPAPEYFSAFEAPLDIASTILSDGLSSRLDKRLVYDEQTCSDVRSFHIAAEIAGGFVVIATARPGAELEEIEAIIAEEIAALAEEGPTEVELDRAKTKLEYQFVSGLERIGGFGGKADLLNQYNTYLGDPGMFAADVERYRAVTADDVRDATRRWLDTDNRLLLRFRPEQSQRPTEVAALDRAAEPALGQDRPFQVPEVHEATLGNGLQLFVVARRELPKVAVDLVTRAGAARDPDGKAGVANLVVRTIDMGTGDRTALELADALGDLGTRLGGSTGTESAQLSLDVLSRNLDPALGILADVVRDPQFPEDEVAREKKRALDNLSQIEKNPNALARRLSRILAFGADHPYGRPAQGLPASVKRIRRDDLVRFHRTYWTPDAAALIMVGDVDLAGVKKLAQKHFGGWSGEAPAAMAIPEPEPRAAGKIYMVDRPDAAQTVVVEMMPAPARSTADYYALRLADAVWGGGGFGTRLNLNLREDKGYSYGVFSNLRLLTEHGSWVASGGVQTDKTSESVVEFVAELKALAGDRPITEQEFEDARIKRLRGYAQQFESLSRVSSQIGSLWTLGLPMSELARERDETARMTLEAVRKAAAEHARPERARLLLVGDRSKIEDGVRALDLGDVELLDSEGRPAGSTTTGRLYR